SAELQDRMLAEVCRVLKPGAIFAGTDSRLSRMFRLLHLNDTMTVVDPDSFESRLHRAGFADISIKLAERAFRFRATRARS
ncbi:MAG TPA: SAM-dependent methyltransferase, partial [Blastocatellia bacterium]|nr:SAM-dependent methyltransferase [Blastocatellia bacterium]